MLSSISTEHRIHITVRLYSILRHRDGKIIDRLEMDLPPGSNVQTVLDDLQVHEELEAILAVNDEVVDAGNVLKEGDRLSIIPSVAGG
jgi:molybdopterin converting factor small subunit